MARQMTTNEALGIIHNHSEFAPDDTEWHKAFDTISERLGVVYDKRTEQFVSADTGHVA
jgi:GrpB-like predicted nucleotidyltransferase (UPF0157 family)